MNDFVVSLIRTYVPVGVGGALGYLASLGINMPEDVKSQLTAGFVGLGIAVYYFIARKLEERFPALGGLLGKRQKPSYTSDG